MLPSHPTNVVLLTALLMTAGSVVYGSHTDQDLLLWTDLSPLSWTEYCYVIVIIISNLLLSKLSIHNTAR